MGWTIYIFHIIIIGRILITVANNKTNRRTCGFTGVDAGQKLNYVDFVSRYHYFGLIWTTTV